jgi:transposase-like protein
MVDMRVKSKRGRPGIPVEIRDRAIELFLVGASAPEVAEELGVSSTVAYELRRFSMGARSVPSERGRHPIDEQVRLRAVRLLEEGVEPSEVMREMGLCQTVVYELLRFIRWGNEVSCERELARAG